MDKNRTYGFAYSWDNLHEKVTFFAAFITLMSRFYRASLKRRIYTCGARVMPRLGMRIVIIVTRPICNRCNTYTLIIIRQQYAYIIKCAWRKLKYFSGALNRDVAALSTLKNIRYIKISSILEKVRFIIKPPKKL